MPALDPIRQVVMFWQIPKRHDANIGDDAAECVRHLHDMSAAGAVIVFHNGNALATSKPSIEFGRPGAFAFTLGIGGRHEAEPRGSISILFTGSDYDQIIERRL